MRNLPFTKIIFFSFLVVAARNSDLRCQDKTDATFYQGIYYISQYITSDEFKSYSLSHSDLESVDLIYEKALNYFNGDFSETCFCLTFSLIPFNRILMRLPGIGIKITIPLPSPPQSLYKKRLGMTPKNLFPDSPRNQFGDKDKLAHFFANAFLKYNVPFFSLSEFLGIFVEYFEQGFFLEGGYDIRDLIANHLGEFYVEIIKRNPKAKPSEAMRIYQLLFFNLYP